MGVALWIGCGLLAGLLARMMRAARPQRWWGELLVAAVTATVFGVLATALDFGGWNELEWRAAAFAFAGALGVLAGTRLIPLMRPSERVSAGSDRLQR